MTTKLQEILFQPTSLSFDKVNYIFNSRLNCIVDYDGESFLIENKLLDINVSGSTLKEAESAFAFTFDALYKNYALEVNSKLSSGALKIKTILLELVKQVIHENKENEGYPKNLDKKRV